jgi:TonB family protein
LIRSFVRGASRHKTALLIDEIGLSFHGHRARLSGRVGLEAVREADLADLSRLGKKVDARFTVKVPVALLREVALVVARQQAAAAKGPAQDPAAAARSIADAMLGKLLAEGYARLENDMLVSTITLRAGILRINGKRVDMPKPAPAPAPAPAPDTAVNFMQARRITESCTLPDYPQDVVAQDSPLGVTLAFVVDPQGQVRELSVVTPSTAPAFDQALLTAFASCRFIPALENGKPAFFRTRQLFTREPGSVRP